ncbi:FAD-dependent oxidoreductase [Parvibacter caecicola]|uniref:FAD-dependent oxidoreductase n=1 Tax=Parvibacter caecicola TaxID=747645 RepID=A0A4V6W9S5_9ACTN|nr:FAD-dependent oxidoreductase [Parvibacter caecicola]TJW09942.1 FAD-dependent oxidoreductase [Parvibacter caecicola]
MADFDAIVVGAGCAGSVAAYELAKVGKSVLLVERGNYAGAKNMTGGRIYSHSLKKVFPHFEEEAPLERRIVRERISLLAPDGNTTIDFSSDEMLKEGQDSYSVLRGPFDQWLASKAEEAGAEAVYGIAVDSLLKDASGKVTGVSAAGDEITANAVLLCDGVNSLLTADAVGFERPAPHTMAVGIKQVIKLPASVITDRILAASDKDGAAWLFAGDATHGHIGGGFMYTNCDSISLGLVATISDLMSNAETPIYQMLEDFKRHPAVAPLIKGGEVVEHSGHMVPEGGLNMMPELVGEGVLLAGESAMMCVNLGYQVRGMDYAVAAGQLAGIAAAQALDAGDTSKAGLAGYVQALEESFVLKDLRQFSRFPHFMESTKRIFNEYPALARDVMNRMFICDGSPVPPMRKSMMPMIKEVGIMNVIKDARGGLKAL